MLLTPSSLEDNFLVKEYIQSVRLKTMNDLVWQTVHNANQEVN